MRSILGLFVIFPLLLKVTLGAVDILATNEACYNALEKETTTTFNPPFNGQISGIRLEWVSGTVSCDNNAERNPLGSNFGCGGNWPGTNDIFIEMIKEGSPIETYYPDLDGGTDGVSSLGKISNNCPTGGGCSVVNYALEGYAAESAVIVLRNPIYQVTTNEVFSLQYGEGCCGQSTGDNAGRACAKVYFSYDDVDPYIPVLQEKNWVQANEYCKDTYGTELATIYDDAHAEELLTIYNQDPISYWIGLNDRVVENTFAYEDGFECEDQLCSGYWMDNQPDDAGNNEDCVHIPVGASFKKMLNDNNCDLDMAFICNAPALSCVDYYQKRNTYFDEELIDQTGVYSIAGEQQRCVFTYIGKDQLFAGTMFESYTLDTKMQCAFGNNECETSSPVNYVQYKWAVDKLTAKRTDASYLFVTCNGDPSMDLVGTTFPDYLLMPFNGELLTNQNFGNKCFATTAISVLGERCENADMGFWMSTGGHFHTDPSGSQCNTCANIAAVVGSDNDFFGYYGSTNNEFYCEKEPSSTTNYFIGEIIDCGCEQHSFDWDELMKSGLTTPQEFIVSQSMDVDDEALTLDIEVTLRYLTKSSADDNGEVYGTTYVLDFEDFDAHKDNIRHPGTCENREETAFNSKSFKQVWEYSDNPALVGHIGEPGNYLAYPPAGKWEISNVCGLIKYSASFTWNQLVQCTNHGGSEGSYVRTADNAGKLTLSGTFYINVVSPYHWESDMGFYRVYQVLSKPFVISIAKTVSILSHTGINLLTMSIIAVYKEGQENTFKLVVLTEAADYLLLSRDGAVGTFVFAPENAGSALETNDFTALQEAETKTYAGDKTGCLNNKANICSQLWLIEAHDVQCSEDSGEVAYKYIDFSGEYSLQFEPECRTETPGDPEQEYCATWLNDHMATIAPDGTGKVLLSATLTWKDEICKAEVFEVEFSADMAFYYDDEYTSSAVTPYLFEPGETIYVEISTNYPADSYSVFDTKLIGVWICTFAPLATWSAVIDAAAATGGCFDNERDATFLPYHIFDVNNAAVTAEGFIDKGHPDDEIQTQHQLRFYFVVPGKISRDKLYVHAQIEVSLVNTHDFGDTSVVRRILTVPVTNQMNHFIDVIGVRNGENKPPQQPPQEPQPQPHNYYHQEPPVFNVPPEPSSFVLLLSSPWIVVLGSLMAVILTFNIVFMCYMKCYKRRGRFSFSRRGSGYSHVKEVDSEDFNDSEVNAINVAE